MAVGVEVAFMLSTTSCSTPFAALMNSPKLMTSAFDESLVPRGRRVHSQATNNGADSEIVDQSCSVILSTVMLDYRCVE